MIDTIVLTHSIDLDPSTLSNSWKKKFAATYSGFRADAHYKGSSLQGVDLRYNAYPGELVIRCSLPKVLHETNTHLLDDAEIAAAVARLDAGITDALSDFNGVLVADAPSVLEWLVRQVDIALNFSPPGPMTSAALRGLLSLQPTRRMKSAVYTNESVTFGSAGKRKRVVLRIYDKEAEVRDRLGAELAKEAVGIIRVELSLREQATVRKVLGLETNRFKDVAVRPLIMDALRRKFGQLHVKRGHATIDVSYDRMLQEFGAKLAPALCHYMKARSLGTDQQVAAKMGLSLGTIQRYRRRLTEHGIHPATVEVSGIHEELLAQIDAAAKPTASSDPTSDPAAFSKLAA